MGKTLIKNIGMILSGNIDKLILDGDSILIEDDKIVSVDQEQKYTAG